MGIEPTSVAWEATALPLSYTRGSQQIPVMNPSPAENGTLSSGGREAAVLPRRSCCHLACGHAFDSDSFPRTGAHAWARRRMFRAALTSRSCRLPQRTHTHRLTISPLTPRGPVRHPHEEQVTACERLQAEIDTDCRTGGGHIGFRD